MGASIKSKFFIAVNIFLIAAIFILGYLNRSYFEMVCAGCAALFWLIQFRLSFILDKDDVLQKVKCKPVGYFMMIPSIGMITIGVLIFFRDYFGTSPISQYLNIVLSGILAACLVIQFVVIWKNKSPAGRFMRQLIISELSSPMTLIIVLILHITSADGDTILSCMSAVLFGVTSLLLSANMILVSSCGYKSTIESIRAIRSLYRQHQLVFIRVSVLKDAFLVAAKAIISVISLSFFMFVNALYSVGMGVARLVAIKMHTQDSEKQIVSYRLVGIIICISSICYVLYSVRLFFGGKSGVYSMNVALVIALYTFVEFGINIREAFRLRKSKALEAKALRAISFSATLLCFVLTQTAIMSFAAVGDNSFTNALSGVVFGGLAALIGLFVIVDSLRYFPLM